MADDNKISDEEFAAAISVVALWTKQNSGSMVGEFMMSPANAEGEITEEGDLFHISIHLAELCKCGITPADRFDKRTVN